MAKTVYVDGTNGSDSNDGLSWALAKETIVGARAATAAEDLVLIAPGVYPEVKQEFSASTDNNVLYRRDPNQPGRVIVDFEDSTDHYASSYWRLGLNNYRPHFLDIHFKNMDTNIAALATCSTVVAPTVMHCVFYEQTGSPKGIGIVRQNNGGQLCNVYNCTFYNLQWGFYDFYGEYYGNYFKDCTTPMYHMSGLHDYNAYPGNTETHGINTSSTDPGLEDPTNEDFTLDPTTDPADWSAFMTAGRQGEGIGAYGNSGYFYSIDTDLSQLSFLSPAPTPAQGNPQPSWENEGPGGTGAYTDGTPTDIVLDSASGDLILDLESVSDATGGRMNSEVMDFGSTSTLIRGFSWSVFQDLPGGAGFDRDDTLPVEQEYRSSAEPFLRDSTLPAWVGYTVGDDLNVVGHRYFQMRLTFRTDHTNS